MHHYLELFYLMSSINKTVFILLVLAFAKAYSQEQPVDSLSNEELEEVIITATRTKRQLSSLPLPVTLIGKKQIRQTGVVRLDEILNEQTGIVTVPDESGFEGVQIQGIASDYILILVDGVPLVGRSAGNFDLSRITVGNIKQIEVVKGPSSALYGSDALGGVINIITEKPRSRKAGGDVGYRYGSYGQQDVNVNLKQNLGKWRYGFFANRFSSEGYDLNPETEGQTVNPFANYTLNGRVYVDLNDKLELFSSTRFYTQNIESGFSTDAEIVSGDSEEQEWNAHARLNHEASNALDLEYEFYYTNYLAEELLTGEISDDVVFDSRFDQTLIRPEVRANYTIKKAGTVTAGVGYQYDQLDRTYFDEQVAFNSQYVYGQWDVELLEKLNVIAGFRFDNHSEYSNQLSPKLALRYELSDAIALKTSVGYGFKAPDFRQLYFDFSNSAVGYTVLGYNVASEKLQELENAGQIANRTVPAGFFDEPIKAESSIGINLGATYRKDKWNGEINFFRNDFSNLIDTQVIARKFNGQNVFSYRNFDEVYFTGAEINLGYEFNQNLNISGGYQLLYAFDKLQEERVADGQVFARDPATNRTVQVERSDYFGLVNRSRHNANLKVFYKLAGACAERSGGTKAGCSFLDGPADFSLRLLYRSKYALFDTNGNSIIDTYDNSFADGFLTTNIAVSKTYFEDFNLQVGANNLLNYRDTNIPNNPGIQGFIKLNYTF